MSTTVSYKGNTIATLNNETKTLTTAGTWVEGNIEIVDTKDNPTLQSKSATPTESSQTIIPDTGYDGLSSVEVGAISSTYVGSGINRRSLSDIEVEGRYVFIPEGYYDSDVNTTVQTGTATTPATTITANPTISVSSSGLITATASASQSIMPTVSEGYITGGSSGTVSVTGSNTQQLTTQAAKTITPIESDQTAVAANVYTTGIIKVDAISPTYVGSGIDQNDSDDLTVSGATVTAPAGYYATAASKSVASGSEGTPTATKGTVSNHSVSVTPSVTNTTGYISGGTHTGTAVSISASELVSGTYTVNSSGTKDVTNYASVSVPAGSEGTPTATKGTVSNHQVSVTPSVTNTTGYITGGTKTGTAVTVTASELASGNKEITSNGTNIDVVGYSTVSVAVPSSSAAIITDTTDAAGGTIRTITTTDEVHLQTKTITPTSSQQTVLPDTGYDGFSSVIVGAGGSGDTLVTKTGTFTGSNGNTAQISCDFEPREIYIRGDLTGDVSLRGIVSLTLIKDRQLSITTDTSTSNTTENAWIVKQITGYNQANSSSEPYASYSNDTLTIDTVVNSSGARFPSGVTYNYTLVGIESPTQHTIHLEFSDNTETDVALSYNDSLIGTMITAYNPSSWAYNNKTVTLAQLDGVTWYEPANIPLNTQLIDYTKCSSDTAINDHGQAVTQQWYYASDYTEVASGMTFTYKAGIWTYIGLYDSSKEVLSVIYVYNDGTADPNDSNLANGTLSGNKLPSGVAYARLSSTGPSSSYMSLIRTA